MKLIFDQVFFYFRVLDTWNWAKDTAGLHYDLITALNLLDRCDTPKTLLAEIHSKLAPGGYLVVAIVLPFSPFVEVGEFYK